MNPLKLEDVTQYVEENIANFHQQRIASLDKLKLSKVLQRKNPYLFRAKHLTQASDIVKTLVDAHISSNEETIFGDWLEVLAIFIANRVFGGNKSSANGIDLEFGRDGIWYIVNIKSGPNWGNKSQKEKMLADFNDAKKTLSTSGSRLNVIAVNGCCYGRDGKSHKFPKKGTDYFKFCGQRFWEFISGDSELYMQIIEPLGHKAKERNEEFKNSYSRILNKFTAEFIADYCTAPGDIDWEKIVRLNSEQNYIQSGARKQAT